MRRAVIGKTDCAGFCATQRHGERLGRGRIADFRIDLVATLESHRDPQAGGCAGIWNAGIQRSVIDLDIAQKRIVFLQSVWEVQPAQMRGRIFGLHMDSPPIEVVVRSDDPVQVQCAGWTDARVETERLRGLQQLRFAGGGTLGHAQARQEGERKCARQVEEAVFRQHRAEIGQRR